VAVNLSVLLQAVHEEEPSIAAMVPMAHCVHELDPTVDV